MSSIASGQLTTSTMTAQQLVNNVLIGGGVAASNVTYTGSANAIGYFDGSNCNVGLNSGIILTTGTIHNTNGFGIPEGPHGPNNESGAGVDNMEPGEPLLAAAAGNPSFNAARLEFDFVPQSDSISFNFVFASEEYLEYVNTGVNDAFGFFISGPNPAGGNFTDQNIALIPGTNQPVTIDDLNATSNAAYYIDNGDGFTAPYNGSNNYIQYDGLTTVLEAKSPVVCGQTYHIIIVISDIGDGVVDSGVFLEEGSFTSPGIDISSDLSFQGSAANDSTLYEGCSDATLWFVRTDSINFQQTITLNVGGTATAGVDYSALPNNIVFPAGQDSVSVQISALADFVAEGTETVEVLISIPSPCSAPIQDSITIYIADVDLLDVDVLGDSVQCPGTSVTLNAQVTGGNPTYSYLWSSGETTSTIHVNPLATTTYIVTVMDTCGQISIDSATVAVVIPQPFNVTILNDTTIYCPNTNVDLSALASGGYGGYTYVWNNGNTNQQITVQPTTTTGYSVEVTDQCGFTTSDSATVTLNEVPLLSAISPDTTICPGISVDLEARGIGGVGNDYTYLWNTNETDSVITVAPAVTTTYTVAIADECGTFRVWDTVTVNVINISANFVAPGPFEEDIEIHFTNLSTGADTYEWTFEENGTSSEEHPSITYETDGNYLITLVAINQSNGCTDTIVQHIEVNPEFYFYAPNSFTPDGDEYNNTFFGTGTGIGEYHLVIYNRWGELLFETKDPAIGWDGTYKGQMVQTGTYIYKFTIYDLRHEVREFMGHVNLIR